MTISIDRRISREVLSSNRSLAWPCASKNCGKVRIFEGGRPEPFRHLDTCPICGSRVATTPRDRSAIATLVDQQLL